METVTIDLDDMLKRLEVIKNSVSTETPEEHWERVNKLNEQYNKKIEELYKKFNEEHKRLHSMTFEEYHRPIAENI